MSFFSNFLSDNAKKLVSTVAKSAADAVSGELSQSFQRATCSAREAAAPVETVDSGVPAGYEDIADAFVDTKLRRVFQKEFPQYEIKEKVSPVTLGGTGKFMPYSFGVYENGAPKLFIMLVSNNTCALRTYRWSKEEAAKAGVPMINFVGAFENEIPYVIDRLHQYL